MWCNGSSRFKCWLLEWIGGRESDGAQAEHLAAQWLAQHRGMRLVAQNWRNPADRREEIDLVLRDGSEMVFVEVKARASSALVPGYYSVGRVKRAVLRRAVNAYLSALRGRPQRFRFDIVEVEIIPDRPATSWLVRHFPGVPLCDPNVRR